jgi:methylmalonyl-CoA/ethylmalonyl-CoA epimerase
LNTFHHIGIFTADLKAGENILNDFLTIKFKSEEIVDEAIGVRILFITCSEGILYELVAPHGKNSPVHGVLKRGVNQLNHVAYMSDDFDREIIKLRRLSYMPLGRASPAVAFEGARVIFFITPLGFVLELIEEI